MLSLTAASSSGDIKDGMRVKASGDITVIGFVESAEIESNGAITVMLGAIGRKRVEGEPFSCSIKSKRSVSLGYAQYCHVESEQDILIERQALHCDLASKRLIKIGKGDKPRGKLIGGNILDAMRIEAERNWCAIGHQDAHCHCPRLGFIARKVP